MDQYKFEPMSGVDVQGNPTTHFLVIDRATGDTIGFVMRSYANEHRSTTKYYLADRTGVAINHNIGRVHMATKDDFESTVRWAVQYHKLPTAAQIEEREARWATTVVAAADRVIPEAAADLLAALELLLEEKCDLSISRAKTAIALATRSAPKDQKQE